MTDPILRSGYAVLKKKPIDKSRVVEVDQKAIDTATFIEQIEMFGSQWNVFEDSRSWQWTQEAETEPEEMIRVDVGEEVPLEEVAPPEQEVLNAPSA
jgi:hypothetical protein